MAAQVTTALRIIPADTQRFTQATAMILSKPLDTVLKRMAARATIIFPMLTTTQQLTAATVLIRLFRITVTIRFLAALAMTKSVFKVAIIIIETQSEAAQETIQFTETLMAMVIYINMLKATVMMLFTVTMQMTR